MGGERKTTPSRGLRRGAVNKYIMDPFLFVDEAQQAWPSANFSHVSPPGIRDLNGDPDWLETTA
jgi:hypothetical protein